MLLSTIYISWTLIKLKVSVYRLVFREFKNLRLNTELFDNQKRLLLNGTC